MKSSLFSFVICIIFPLCGNTLKGQTVVLSENFSGFLTGSHATPSTSDASATLDTRTQVPGWSGSGIYPAAGEIKVSTATVNGWIETPSVDLSGYGGEFRLKFDICRWPGDVTSVQVLLNGTSIGTNLTPGDNYETVTIDGSGGMAASKIRIQSISKRFYLDNFSITVNNLATGIYNNDDFPAVKIYPVPAGRMLHLENIQHVTAIEISDLSGRTVRIIKKGSDPSVQAEIEDLDTGVYIIRLVSPRGVQIMKFLKL